MKTLAILVIVYLLWPAKWDPLIRLREWLDGWPKDKGHWR